MILRFFPLHISFVFIFFVIWVITLWIILCGVLAVVQSIPKWRSVIFVSVSVRRTPFTRLRIEIEGNNEKHTPKRFILLCYESKSSSLWILFDEKIVRKIGDRTRLYNVCSKCLWLMSFALYCSKLIMINEYPTWIYCFFVPIIRHVGDLLVQFNPMNKDNQHLHILWIFEHMIWTILKLKCTQAKGRPIDLWSTE